MRCAPHNQYQADLDFGRNFMDGWAAPVRSPGNVA
jgi:hypothetical protein